ncbi:chromosome replication/partitioning protein (plasmid) [Borrelia miyamotoi]|uniref:Chromosome replication/partitioning protein n=1 Tax=Borrelia miyamotoi TaxID=47466 RepID=A0AAX3JP00_9SPIR|nr:chromosome replication/partitioning protein [Borrelia miyamotoi]QFP42336.1 chromosome replication/partitioning protein [Borrelia miyamotoi]QFP48456.1 chromosome replication/partitioning protein [Borrelia miyamotoi]WAZ72355.1 chromosome replication/partitioning protein [Borrelia miyamotoi]
MGVEVNKRNLAKEITPEERISIHYNKLKEKLKINFQKEIFCKIEAMKVLKEIKDKEYYKLDNYASFDDFAKDYRLARTQTYKYLKIATAIEEGIVEEKYVINNGINNTMFLIRNKEGVSIKKSKQNPLRPLRFQLKCPDAYAFYKRNAKLTSFLLEKVFLDEQEFLSKIINQFDSIKKGKK